MHTVQTRWKINNLGVTERKMRIVRIDTEDSEDGNCSDDNEDSQDNDDTLKVDYNDAVHLPGPHSKYTCY